MRKATAADNVAEGQVQGSSDMTRDQIRELILEEVGVGESFHPSDIAVKHGLDFDTVLEVVDRLRSEGRMGVGTDARDAE